MIERLNVAVPLAQEVCEVEVGANRGCGQIVVQPKLQRMSEESHRLLAVPALHCEDGIGVQGLREALGYPQLLADVERGLDTLARGVGIAIETQHQPEP